MQVVFLKVLSSSGVFLTFLLQQINYMASLSSLSNVNIVLNVNIIVSINNYSFKYIFVLCHLKFVFINSPVRQWRISIQLILQNQTVVRDFNALNRNAA